MPDKSRMRLGAVVLAGGRGTRMGRAKEALPFGDATLLGHIVNRLAAIAQRVVVVGRDLQQELPQLAAGTLCAVDDRTNGGPLAGLCTGLRALRDAAGFADDDVAFVTGCDMPFVDRTVIDGLLAHLGTHAVLMPRVEVLQPLCALYRIGAIGYADALLDRGERTPRSMASHPNAMILPAATFATFCHDGRALRNVNTPADYEAALAELDDAS